MIKAGAGLDSAAESAWYRRIDAEVPDLGTALDCLESTGRTEDVLWAAGALGPYRLNRSRFTARRCWLDADVPDSGVVSPEVALIAKGWSVRLVLDGPAS